VSRSGYDDGINQWDLIRWRGAVASAIRGKRGQALLRELLGELDSMPESNRRLIGGLLEEGGEVCALGAVGRRRGVDMGGIDEQDPEQVAAAFRVSEALVREITNENDDGPLRETPEQRWQRMREWVIRRLNAGKRQVPA